MMDWTDRHQRMLMRAITRGALLYTEMVTMNAVLRGDLARLLAYSEAERPLVLQLGGDDPKKLAACARIAEDWGYDEVNLNVGCPSARVQSGNFGACLMAQPERVAACVAAMGQAVKIPVTVKHRLGVDDMESYALLANFMAVVAAAGCQRFTVHARKAWLAGLSPKENRTIPPLRYDWVYRLKKDFPRLVIELNGGVRTLGAVQEALAQVDGVMLGRAAYETPYELAAADALFFAGAQAPSRGEVLEAYLPYVAAQLARGVPLKSMTRHMHGLFAGMPGARAWRRVLSEEAHKHAAGLEVLEAAAAHVPAEVLAARPLTVQASLAC